MPKILVCKGEGTKKLLLSLVVTAAVIMQTSVPKNSVSKVLEIQVFPGEHAPGNLYFVIHRAATLPHQLFHYKIQPGLLVYS